MPNFLIGCLLLLEGNHSKFKTIFLVSQKNNCNFDPNLQDF
ncbi:hypothetical protein HMPREF1551_00248 [Capnocytophaga sp. oral taxon 863 str. F0517]|nr:hypothetical protein HMPREF1551_00248 [Capnocytophaga sp. oral taxon 863 str. F0517]